MADRLALAFALILLPTAAAAQLSAVGVSVALNHHQYADVQSLCCPPLAWATCVFRTILNTDSGRR